MRSYCIYQRLYLSDTVSIRGQVLVKQGTLRLASLAQLSRFRSGCHGLTQRGDTGRWEKTEFSVDVGSTA